ncbi:MAG: hypothetical protein LAT84_06450 [Balneolia bacterium]|nr:hypothetical protein [Balneolia bacterium]
MLNRITITLLIVISAALLTWSCSDSSSSSVDPDPEIVGFLIEEQGVEIVRYESGSYTFNANYPEYVVDNEFMLSTSHLGGNLVRTSAEEEEIGGRRYFTPSVTIRFIMDDGAVVDLPEERTEGGTGPDINPEGFYRLNVEWTDPADIRGANIEQHGSDGSWMFHIRADYVGSAGLIFRVDRCGGERELEAVPGENHRQDQIRICSVEEETVFRASAPMPIAIDSYDLAEQGKYPHNRHERQR